MGIHLILMIAERRIRKTSTKENKIRISMILPRFRMCTIFFRVRNILRYNYAVVVSVIKSIVLLVLVLYIFDIL